jgi:hypothetical protein
VVLDILEGAILGQVMQERFDLLFGAAHSLPHHVG